VLDNLFGETKAVSCLGASHIRNRVEESGKTFAAHTEDGAVATDELEGGGFRVQWELFLRHVAGEVPTYEWDLLAGAKGVQLAEAGLQSWAERRWIDIAPLSV
jgi:hypothetical protein